MEEIEVVEEKMEEMQALQRKQIVLGNKTYMKMLENIIKQLEEYKPEDRLAFANGILMVINAMAGSIQGWSKWCNINVMSSMNKEELEKCFEKMRTLAIEWLRCDYEITESKTLDMEKSETEEETTRSGKSSKKKPNLYVA